MLFSVENKMITYLKNLIFNIESNVMMHKYIISCDREYY